MLKTAEAQKIRAIVKKQGFPEIIADDILAHKPEELGVCLACDGFYRKKGLKKLYIWKDPLCSERTAISPKS